MCRVQPGVLLHHQEPRGRRALRGVPHDLDRSENIFLFIYNYLAGNLFLFFNFFFYEISLGSVVDNLIYFLHETKSKIVTADVDNFYQKARR